MLVALLLLPTQMWPQNNYITKIYSSCIHIHNQLISLCPVCTQRGDTMSTHLFYHFCAGTGRVGHRHIYFKVASLVPSLFGKLVTRPKKLTDWRGKNLPWSSAPGDSRGTEMAKRLAETMNSSDAFPKLNQRETTKIPADGQWSQEKWCNDGPGLKQSWWENDLWSQCGESQEQLHSHCTRQKRNSFEPFLHSKDQAGG